MAIKNDPNQFSNSFEIFLAAMVEISDLALRTYFDSFRIYNINLLIKKKKIPDLFHYF